MLDEEHSGAGHLLQAPQQRDEGFGLALGDAGRGLVEQQQPGPGQEDRRQVDDAARAGGEMGGLVVTESLQAERPDDGVHVAALGPFGPARPRELQRVVDNTSEMLRASSVSSRVSSTSVQETAGTLGTTAPRRARPAPRDE